MRNYFDNTSRKDVLSGGVRMIPIQTPKGNFKVWTKRVGNNPRLKLLLLHGGPGATHEYLEACDSFLPASSIATMTNWGQPLATSRMSLRSGTCRVSLRKLSRSGRPWASSERISTSWVNREAASLASNTR